MVPPFTNANTKSSESVDARIDDAIAAEQRLKAREDFLKLLSHEIRTPLNGVMGMLSLLSRTTLSAEQDSYIQTARDSGEHLLSMVNDLLDYARIDAGHVGLEITTVDLELLLQGVAELLSPRAHAGGIEIVWSLDPQLNSIQADEGRLRQILFNLAGNALKFTKSGGVLMHISLTGNGRIRFDVTDTGPGIPDEARSRIFEEYGQVDPTHATRYGGAGLGLVVVKKLVEAMDGDLSLRSEMGVGSSFTFEFRAPYSLRKIKPDNDLPQGVTLITGNGVLAQGARVHLMPFGAEVRMVTRPAPPEQTGIVLADRAAFPDGPMQAPGPRSLILLAPEQRSEIDTWREKGWSGYLIKPLRRKSLMEQVRSLHLNQALDQGPTSETSLKPHNHEDDRVAAPSTLGTGFEPQVLLVEDNPVNALLAKILLQREGCMVERVSCGEEAVQITATRSFDIIFMDLGLPGLDGIGATKVLRERGLTTPIIALTANAYEEDRRACLQAGMNDFLTKPIEINAMRQKLVRWVTKPQMQKLA